MGGRVEVGEGQVCDNIRPSTKRGVGWGEVGWGFP